MVSVDPFDAHDNIIAGTAHLKDMQDRFGSAGFLAAYIPRVQRGMNSTSRQGDRFHRKRSPTLRQSRHCSTMGRANTRQFTSDVQFLGRKHRCLSSVPKRRDRNLVCIRAAEMLHRNGSRLTRSCVSCLRSYRDDRKCILSYAASCSWKACSSGIGRWRRATEEGKIKRTGVRELVDP